MDYLRIIGGLAAMIVGGELLVRGASRLAVLFRVPPLVIGLTVVAFGTGAPELAVTLRSSVTGNTELAVGNIVGSNIANVLLVLGISALVAPLIVASQLVRREVPLMIIASSMSSPSPEPTARSSSSSGGWPGSTC